ncbi:putative membrane protein [Methanobacterium aggregans]|nr:putative membrane protein [Methanobacterium aggregans]
MRNFIICHRKPERTFKIRGHYFPVCSRCTGLYIGAFSYFIYAYFFYVEYSLSLIALAILMIIPTFTDGFTQLLGFRESNNILRFTTGLIGGLGLGILVKALKWGIIMGLRPL